VLVLKLTSLFERVQPQRLRVFIAVSLSRQMVASIVFKQQQSIVFYYYYYFTYYFRKWNESQL